MSVYNCIDTLEEIIRKASPKKLSEKSSFFNRIKYRKLTPSDVTQLQRIKRLLEDKVPKIDEAIKKLQQLTLKSTNLTNEIQMMIVDLRIVKDGRYSVVPIKSAGEKKSKVTPKKPSNYELNLIYEYQELINSRLLIANLRQGQMKELGSSAGECYGFTFSMADSNISPYKKPEIKEVTFNKTVHNYQKNQLIRKKDQARIKKQRLTRKYFCPSLQEQAEKLANVAEKNRGEDLLVSLSNNKSAHAAYLSMQNDGKIRYSEPNHGVFLFDNKKQFISAYRLIYQYQKTFYQDSTTYKYYQVSRLKEDKGNKLKESKSFKGKLRSLLTGQKYYENKGAIAINLTSGLIYSAAGAAIGAAIGSMVAPGLGTIIGGIVGGTLGSYGSSIAGSFLNSKGLRGLLGPYHYIREKFHIKSDTDEIPTLDIPEIEPTNSSTSKMINQLGKLSEDHKPVPVKEKFENLESNPKKHIKTSEFNDKEILTPSEAKSADYTSQSMRKR
jgi:hypothetical protein